ncbi:hypothetical protein HBB16_21785 [Pseudonocardia sp. MCCB 268]|nr:hypothetical protein [Pseudonocardia cytotoxica]
MSGITWRPAGAPRLRSTPDELDRAGGDRAGHRGGRFLGTVQLANGLFPAVIALVGGRPALEGAITVGNLVSAVGWRSSRSARCRRSGWWGSAPPRPGRLRPGSRSCFQTPGRRLATGRPPRPRHGHWSCAGCAIGPIDGLTCRYRPVSCLAW